MTEEEYTPTDQDMRDHIVWVATEGNEEAHLAAFNRWLEAHDAEVRERALAAVDVHDVELLRAEKAALAAVIEQVNSLADRWEYGATRWADPLPVPVEVEQVRAITRQADTDAALREVRAKAFEEASGYFGENQMTREGDVKEWLRNKAFAIREGRA